MRPPHPGGLVSACWGVQIRFGYLERCASNLTEKIPFSSHGSRKGAAGPTLGQRLAMPGMFARLPETALDLLSDRISPVGTYYA